MPTCTRHLMHDALRDSGSARTARCPIWITTHTHIRSMACIRLFSDCVIRSAKFTKKVEFAETSDVKSLYLNQNRCSLSTLGRKRASFIAASFGKLDFFRKNMRAAHEKLSHRLVSDKICTIGQPTAVPDGKGAEPDIKSSYLIARGARHST